jgi:hypothetical protein
MEALGCKIEDIEFKDVLLMHLDESFHAARISILTQSVEPSLDDIKRILTSSTSANNVTIKIEPQDTALAARSRFSRFDKSTRSGRDPLVDDKGYRWCDINSDGCYRCGKTGHVASRCMYNMPQHVKDYIMNSRSLSPSRSSNQHGNSTQVHQASSAHILSSHPPSPHWYTSHSIDPNSSIGPLLL